MITVSNEGGDRLRIVIRGHVVYADQPVSDGGWDTAPSPSELFLGSLAACVAFYAGRFLRRHGLGSEGLSVGCEYAWAQNPNRVGEIQLVVAAPTLTPQLREAFARVIEHCTVHNTLRQPPVVRTVVAVGQSRAAAAG